jgi:hypothetical protein
MNLVALVSGTTSRGKTGLPRNLNIHQISG